MAYLYKRSSRRLTHLILISSAKRTHRWITEASVVRSKHFSGTSPRSRWPTPPSTAVPAALSDAYILYCYIALFSVCVCVCSLQHSPLKELRLFQDAFSCSARARSEPIAYGDSEDSPGILPRLPFLEADGGISFSLRYKKSYPASARVIHRRRRKECS